MRFGSDNHYGVDPRILAAIVAANEPLTDIPYCHDDGSKAVEARLSEIFETPVKTFLVVNGTGANSLSLSTITPPHGGVLCHAVSHINTDECNCPELFTGGAKLLALSSVDAKITPAMVEARLKLHGHGEHGPKPSAISITNATEMGTVYSPADVKALADFAKPLGLKLHMDGSRFANALVGQGCTPAELTWKSGIDVLSFGGTKNGGLLLEAVVFFDHALAEDFLYRRKRVGQLVSKGRFLSAQMLAYLQNDVWLANARHANAMAKKLSEGIAKTKHMRLAQKVQANEVFAVMPRKTFAALEKAGAHFYEWPIDGLSDDEVHCRFVLSFATPEAHVDQFLKLAQGQS